MAEYTLIATSSFGLESVVAYELRKLGYSDLTVENGKVTFKGRERDIVRCNICLRTADRVLVKVAEFEARDFDQLFQGTSRVGWADIIPVDGKMHVTGKSFGSLLASVSDCQSIVKKAIVEGMKKKYRVTWFEETGPVYKVEVSLFKNRATLTIDTTGAGLHKRGYRTDTGEAPLRETLAAGLVLISRWTPDKVLADPLCGSGTIAVEAALIGKNIAPGLKRSFVSEGWGQIPKKVWDSVREEARAGINGSDFRILASDSDGSVLKKARDNAVHAGVGDFIAFQKMTAGEFRSHKKYGYIICNPPYGLRMGEEGIVEELYRSMGEMFRKLDSWSLFVLTAHPDFQKLFGKRADKNRKLYNGDIKCYYYQYTAGELPRHKPHLIKDDRTT
jgi:putative N6-adenine-specific DNA methylase